ncbi:hypothetical protein BGZ47_000559, partial [Haplosporangium gracile]
MDLSRLLNPLGSDFEQAPSPPEPTTAHTDSTHPNSYDNATSTFRSHQQQQQHYHDKRTDGRDADRQEFIKSTINRHDRTSSVEQLGGLATLNIEGGHQYYHNQQLSPRHDYPSDGGGGGGGEEGRGSLQYRHHHVTRPGLHSRPSWENIYFPAVESDDRMDQDYHHYQQQRQQHHYRQQQQHMQRQQHQQEQLQREQLTSPRTKRKYLKKSPTPSFAKPTSFGSNSHQQQDSDELEDGRDDDEEGGGGSSGTSNSNTTSNGSSTLISMSTTGGGGSGSGGGGGGMSNSGSNNKSAGAAKRRRPLFDQIQESGDLSSLRQSGGQQRQQQQQQQQQSLFRDPVQQTQTQTQQQQQQQYRQQPQDRRNSGSSIGSSSRIETNPTEPGSLVAAASSPSSALSRAAKTLTQTQATTPANGIGVPLTFERSGDG